MSRVWWNGVEVTGVGGWVSPVPERIVPVDDETSQEGGQWWRGCVNQGQMLGKCCRDLRRRWRGGVQGCGENNRVLGGRE